MAEQLFADDPRRAIGHEHDLAADAASAVGLPLGVWAGRGDWAGYSADFRDEAGRRALAELDAAIAGLVVVRDKLAHAVSADLPITTPALLHLSQNDAYNLDAMVHAGYRQLRDEDMPEATAAALGVLRQVVDAITPIRKGGEDDD